MISGKKKLLIVTTVPGTFHSILKDQPIWLSQYYSVSLITSPEKKAGNNGSNESIKVLYVPMERGISLFRDLISIFRMVRAIKKVNPDIIHSYTPKAGLVAMISGAICQVKVRIHTFTGLIFPTRKGVSKRLLMLIDSLICKCATHVVPEGRGVANDLASHRITKKTMNLIGNGNIAGVDVQHFSPNSRIESTKFGASDTTFGFIGRLSKDKGVSELVKSFDALPNTAKLIIAGSLDERDPILDWEFQFLKEHPRIEFRGWVDDVRDLLNSCDVLVLPSYREGFPNVLLQAGSMAVPVIATDVSGSNEIVVDGINGWLIPVRDSDALTKAMLDVLNLEKVKLHKMGQAARERVVNDFEQSFYRRNLLDFYEETLREANY